MVGSHTIIGRNSNIKVESLNFLKHELWFRIEQIDFSDNIAMFMSSYNGYPYMVFKDVKWIVILEGMIYNLSNEEIKNRCEEIAYKFVNNKDYFNAIQQFIDVCDGEFFIQVYDKQIKKYIGFNDHLGRLPVYYSNDSETFIISRDIKTNLEFGTTIDFDLTGIAEFLILGYSLGNKTYFSNIRKLEPYQALLIEDISNIKKYTIRNTSEIHYGVKKNKTSREETLSKLRDTFLTDTRNRINKLRESGYDLISDLSGGFDSRAIIGGISKFDRNFKYFTYEYVQDESKEAQQAFNELEQPGEYIKLKFNNELNEDTITDLVYKTNATVDFLTTSVCYNDMASLKEFLNLSNKVAHFGGYGGEFIRVPEKHFFKSIFYGIETGFYSSVTIDDTVRILNSNINIKNEIKSYFQKNYKENKEAQLKRFFYEYSKVPLAGEERSRLFRWTVHPMWSKNWIKTVYENVPLKWTGYKFFIQFLEKVDNKLLNVLIYKRNDLDMNSLESIENYERKNKRELSFKKKLTQTIKFYLPFLSIIYGKLTNNSSDNERSSIEVYDTFLVYYNKLNRSKTLFNLDRVKNNINSFGKQYNKLTTLAMYLYEIEKRYSNKIVEVRKNV